MESSNKLWFHLLSLEQEKFLLVKSLEKEPPLSQYEYLFSWARKYPIVGYETLGQFDPFMLDCFVLKYMSIHGIESVRGGSFSQEQVPKILIQKMIDNALENPVKPEEELPYYSGEEDSEGFPGEDSDEETEDYSWDSENSASGDSDSESLCTDSECESVDSEE